MQPLRIYIGYDSHEVVAYHVLAHSILARASVPVSITPLVQSTLRASGLYTRERNAMESTEFSFTRFLVPYLAGHRGLAIFMDCDMLCRADVAELVALHTIGAAVSVVQHDYTPRETTKFLGNRQTSYPRKNWSSLMVFDAGHARCQRLTPEVVNTATGLELHRLLWAEDRLGALPLAWNYLVGEDNQSPDPPKLVHFTNGTPCFPEYRDCDYADEWRAEAARMRARRPMAVRQRA